MRIQTHESINADGLIRFNRLTRRLNAVMGYDDTSFTLETRLRRAMRAAKFEETPLAVWRKILPTIPEGVSTTRANEMFCWARSLIVDEERRNGASEAEAHRNAAQRMWAGHAN